MMTLDKRAFTMDVQVRFRDCDGLGHINNAVYHSYIEQLRCQWLEETGICSPMQKGDRIPLILARAEIDFIRPGFLHDQILATGWVSHIGTKSFRMDYRLESQRGEICRSQAVLVWYDYDGDCSVPIPETVRKVLSRWQLQAT